MANKNNYEGPEERYNQSRNKFFGQNENTFQQGQQQQNMISLQNLKVRPVPQYVRDDSQNSKTFIQTIKNSRCDDTSKQEVSLISPNQLNQKCRDLKINLQIVQEQIKFLEGMNCICLDLIGKGNFSLVIKAHFKNEDIAVKIIEQANFSQQKINHDLLKNNHNTKYILDIKLKIDIKQTQFIFTDLCQGELSKLILEHLSKQQIISIIVQLLYGLEELQQYNIIHVDIKPQNILYNEENGNYSIKIADFSQSKHLNNQEFTFSLSRAGTYKYTSLEVLLGDRKKITYKIDIYSLGIDRLY